MKNHLLVLLGGVFIASNCYAAGYKVTQVTDNAYADEYARLNEKGDLVWASWPNVTDPGWTLFKYDAVSRSTSMISDNSVFYNSHQLNNNGDVVWMAYDGYDQEIYLYQAATKTTARLTNNDNDDTNPQISDNGDVTWLQQQGTSAAEAILMRYDAATKASTVVDFPGATRQGYQTMNSHGDVAWNAVLADSQQILLYSAATGAIANISMNEGVVNSNQRVTDNGDVVWETYDLATSAQGIMYYRAADSSLISVVNDIGGHLFGSHGNAVWVSSVNGAYVVSSYDPVTGKVKLIATETSSFAPNITGISMRGDVTWSIISGTSWMSKVYNADRNNVVTLTNTQGSGTYDLNVADNGDVVWSLWDGTDYEVYSYQADSEQITQLSDNQVDDGITIINGSGTILWNRFDTTDNELVLAERNQDAFDINVLNLKFDRRNGAVNLMTRMINGNIPTPGADISIKLNGETLVYIAFGEFRSKATGVYRYKTNDTEVMLNFNDGMLAVKRRYIPVSAMMAINPAAVAISMGQQSATVSYMFR